MFGEKDAASPYNAFFYYFKDNIDAVRSGKWKLHIRKGDQEVRALYNLDNAKVAWAHSDTHLDGKLNLPQGFWMDNLDPVGSAVITLAGVEVADQSVEFELKGKEDDKWEYKDKENFYGNIKDFKIDWTGAKFDYKSGAKNHKP